MQLEKAKVRIRCELGACKAKADYTIRMARVGIRSRIHVCSDCLSDLADCIKQANVGAGIDRPKNPPKSVETLKPKKDKAMVVVDDRQIAIEGV